MKIRTKVLFQNQSLEQIKKNILEEFENRKLYISNSVLTLKSRELLVSCLSPKEIKKAINSLAISFEISQEFYSVNRRNLADTMREARLS